MTESRSTFFQLTAAKPVMPAIVAAIILALAPASLAQSINYTEFYTGPAMPVLTGGGAGAWDETIREKVQVFQDETGFKMWYVGHSAAGQATSKIGYATSPDGITWTKFPGNPVLSRNNVKDQDISIIRQVDGTYWMYIEVNDAWIDLFLSSDGINWSPSPANPVKTTAASPVVWREGSSWYMLYEHMAGATFDIWLATSPDGLVWTDSPANPVVADTLFTAPDSILKEGTQYHLYYHNADNDSWHAISDNLTTWTQRQRILEGLTSPAVFRTTSGELWCYLWEHDGTIAPSRYFLRRGMSLQYPLVWALDDGTGTVATGAGDQFHGKLMNGPTWVSSPRGGALSFDGIDDFVQTDFKQSLAAWTVAGWVRGQAAPSSGPSTGPIQRGAAFQLNWNHPETAFRGAAALQVGGNWYAASFGPLSGNTWYHLAATYDGETLRAYKNGLPVSSNASPSGPPASETLRLVMGRNAEAENRFAGSIDDVRIYNTALDAAAISVLGSVPPDTTPPGSSALGATVSGQTVSLSWTAAIDSDSGISNYRVYRGTTAGAANPLLVQTSGDTLAHVDAGGPNTTYYYDVRAVNGSGVEGPASNQVVVITGNVAPAAPTGLTAVLAGGGNIALDWADNTETDFAAYRVYRRVGAAGSYSHLGPDLTMSSLTDTGLSQGTTYFYLVTAIDSGGLESGGSAEVSATVLTTEPGLAARWDLNDAAGTVATDIAGGADGTLQNGPVWTTGIVGGALSLDGINDYVSTPFSRHLASWSVGVWVWSPTTPANALGSGPVQRAANFQINWNHPDANFRGAAALRVGGNWYAARFGTLAASTWYYLAATYDGETLRAYRDGVLITSNTAPSGPAAADTGLMLGRHATRNQFFAGIIAGVRVYDIALDAATIANLSSFNPDSTPPGSSTLTASVTGQSVNLSWTAASDPESGVGRYRIYRGISGGTGKTLLSETTGVTHTDNGAPNTTYYYDLAAVNGAGIEGPLSNEVVVVTGNAPPAAPVGVTATAIATDVVLDWSDNTESDLAGYQLYRRTGSSGPFSQIGSILTTSMFTDPDLIQGTTYSYVVTALDASGLESAQSAVVSATVLSTEAGLVARWQLDEGSGIVAADSAGTSHGSLVNGPVWTAGILGAGLSLDGIDDHVTTGFAQHLPNWSVAVWVWGTAVPGSGPASGPVQREANFQINWNHPDANFRGAAALRVGGNWYAARFGTLAAGTWYHVTATYDGQTLRAYRDGVLITSNASPFGAADADSRTVFLGRHATRAQYFGGAFDDVRIYSRALSDSEVAALAASR
jgi:fibronectin type 3 domain-containing protein